MSNRLPVAFAAAVTFVAPGAVAQTAIDLCKRVIAQIGRAPSA